MNERLAKRDKNRFEWMELSQMKINVTRLLDIHDKNDLTVVSVCCTQQFWICIEIVLIAFALYNSKTEWNGLLSPVSCTSFYFIFLLSRSAHIRLFPFAYFFLFSSLKIHIFGRKLITTSTNEFLLQADGRYSESPQCPANGEYKMHLQTLPNIEAKKRRQH